MEPSATASRTDGWLASGREKPILRRRRRPPRPRPRRRGSPPASCAAMWWHTPAPPLSSGLILSTTGCAVTAKWMRPAAGRYRSCAGRRWAAAVAKAPARTGLTGSGSTWTHAAPQCRQQQHDRSPLPLWLRCCRPCQNRPFADDDAVRAVRVQRVAVAQHGHRPGGQQAQGHGQR